jgi:hypothetical protein
VVDRLPDRLRWAEDSILGRHLVVPIHVAAMRPGQRNHSASSSCAYQQEQHGTVATAHSIHAISKLLYVQYSALLPSRWFNLACSSYDGAARSSPLSHQPRRIWSELHLNVCHRSTTTPHSITHASHAIISATIGVATRWPPWKCTPWARAVRTRSLTRSYEQPLRCSQPTMRIA